MHDVFESFLESKKYIVPSGVANPIFAGCVRAVYFGSEAGHFDPGDNAMTFAPGNPPELPLTREERNAYRKALKGLLPHTPASQDQARTVMRLGSTCTPTLKTRVSTLYLTNERDTRMAPLQVATRGISNLRATLQRSCELSRQRERKPIACTDAYADHDGQLPLR